MKDNIVKLATTTMHGHIYHVFDKKNPYKRLYMGQISNDPRYNYCECTGWALLEKCYHNETARETMEVKII